MAAVPPPRSLRYPKTFRGSDVMHRHGYRVADPYRWLAGEEQGAVAEWTAAQQALTDAYLAAGPEQGDIASWLTAFLDRPFVFHATDTRTKRFMLEDRPDRNQPVLLVQRHGERSATLLFDPDTTPIGGRNAALVQEAIFPSPCGRYVAFAVRASEDGVARLVVMEVERAELVDTAFTVTIMPSVSWAQDGTGFFYNQNQGQFIDEARRAERADGVYWHRLGTSPERDEPIFGMEWPEAHVAIPTATANGEFLFVNLLKLVSHVSALYALRLTDGHRAGPAIPLSPIGAGAFGFVGEYGNRYFFETNIDGAGNGKVVAFDISSDAVPSRVDIVPEQCQPLALTARATHAEHSVVVGGSLYLTYIDGNAHRVAEYDLSGRYVRDLNLGPAISVAGQGGDRYGNLSASADGNLLIDLWTYTQAPTAYLYRLDTDELAPVLPHPPPSLPGVTIGRVSYPAADGTHIPATIISLESAVPEAGRPWLLYGYGGAGMPITPEFSLDIVAWLALGGAYVIANIRGGGEFGESWHRAASGPNKPLTFADFCDAAEHLISARGASPERLAIRGISYGGLLVGACVNRSPQLFAAAVAEIPMLDPLSIGEDYWSSQLSPEIGNPKEDKAAFELLSTYSPLQNLRGDVRYPAMLVVAADQDAPLLVSGARKFVATLQASDMEDNLCLLHIVRGAGHGGWSKPQMIDTTSREVAFLAKNLSAGFRFDRLSPQKGNS